MTGDEVEFALGEVLVSPEQVRPQTSLLLAVFKFDRFEWAIEKATELGATDITPVIARRTEKHLAVAAEKRAERWRRIALEAAQQSRQPNAPTIHNPVPLKRAMDANANTRIAGVPAPTHQHILLAETERQHSLWSALADPQQPLTLAIGPEGGWTEDEFKLFSENRWTFASLGDSILRAETATIAALAVVNQARLAH